MPLAPPSNSNLQRLGFSFFRKTNSGYGPVFGSYDTRPLYCKGHKYRNLLFIMVINNDDGNIKVGYERKNVPSFASEGQRLFRQQNSGWNAFYK